MMLLFRCLALTSGVLLALPTGWCCSVGLDACCGKSGELVDRDGDSKPTGGGSCCLGKTATHEPGELESAPVPRPQVDCCCVKPHVVRPDVDGAPILDLDSSIVLLEPANDSEFEREPCDQVVFDGSPPRNILHCVWLC